MEKMRTQLPIRFENAGAAGSSGAASSTSTKRPVGPGASSGSPTGGVKGESHEQTTSGRGIGALPAASGCGGFRDVYEDIFGSEPGQAGEPRSQTSLLLPVDIDDSLSPYAAQSDMNLSITSLLFDPLFVTDNTFAVHPCLAKSINEAGGGEYLVTLRDDVAFSDGTALTAADVVYSFGQTELQQKRYWQLHTSVESVTEVDPHTVRVKAYRSDRNIAGLLDFPSSRMAPVPIRSSEPAAIPIRSSPGGGISPRWPAIRMPPGRSRRSSWYPCRTIVPWPMPCAAA